MAKINGFELTNIAHNLMTNKIVDATLMIDSAPAAQIHEEPDSNVPMMVLLDQKIAPRKLLGALTMKRKISENDKPVEFYQLLQMMSTAEENYFLHTTPTNSTFFMAIVPDEGNACFAAKPKDCSEEEALQGFKAYIESNESWKGMNKYIAVMKSPDDFNIGEPVGIENFYAD